MYPTLLDTSVTRARQGQKRMIPLGPGAVQAILHFLDMRAMTALRELRCRGAVHQQARPAAEHAQRSPQAGQIPAGGGTGSVREPPHATAQFRHTYAAARGRPAKRAGDARPPEPEHDPDLHAPEWRAGPQNLRRSAPAGVNRFGNAIRPGSVRPTQASAATGLGLFMRCA